MLVRAYDDGVAFRYIFPEGFSGDSILITEEMTSFRFNDADTAWWAPAEDFAYESLYKKNNVKHVGAASTPFTVKWDTIKSDDQAKILKHFSDTGNGWLDAETFKKHKE